MTSPGAGSCGLQGCHPGAGGAASSLIEEAETRREGGGRARRDALRSRDTVRRRRATRICRHPSHQSRAGPDREMRGRGVAGVAGASRQARD